MGHDTELQAFGQLVELHYAAVAAVAFATTRDLALAEDIAQDTFIAAWSQRGRLRDLSRVRPWLCGIARNQSRNALRRRRREIGANDDQLTDPSPSALARAVDREALSELRTALASLPDAYRESLVLYYWEERSIAQVASVLAISEEAAQKRISRGRALLRDGIAERIEQVGSRRRAANAAAASVVAVLLARGGAAHAAIRPSVEGGLARLTHVAVRALIPAVIGGAVVLAYTTTRHEEPPPCCAATADALAENGMRLQRLTNKVIRLEFENRARDEQAAAADAPAAAPPPTPAPAPRRRTAAPKIDPIVAAVTTPSGSPLAATPLTDAEAATAVTKQPACDVIECTLENFPGACCQAVRASLKEVPSGIPGIRSYDLSTARVP